MPITNFIIHPRRESDKNSHTSSLEILLKAVNINATQEKEGRETFVDTLPVNTAIGWRGTKLAPYSKDTTYHINNITFKPNNEQLTLNSFSYEEGGRYILLELQEQNGQKQAYEIYMRTTAILDDE